MRRRLVQRCGLGMCVLPVWLAGATIVEAGSESPAGIWHLHANSHRLTLVLGDAGGDMTGTIAPEGEAPQALADITWDAVHRWLEFRRVGPGFHQWYRMSLVKGIAAGRFSHGATAIRPALTAYAWHVTGWNADILDAHLVPRTWRLTLDRQFAAVLRVDRDAAGLLVGRLKVFNNAAMAGVQEELEYDLHEIAWDGSSIAFSRRLPTGVVQRFSGTVTDRFVAGTFTHGSETAPRGWSGTRAEVLGFGLGSRLSNRAAWRADREVWQAHTRKRLMNLTQGLRLTTTPPPLVTVTELPCVGCPFTTGSSYPPERDDDPERWPPHYTLRHLRFSLQVTNRFAPDHPPPAREFLGYLSVPHGDPPAGGFPAAVVLNGHGSSARHVFQQDDGDPTGGGAWYGESAARRGMVVLAVDIGHRPEWHAGAPVHPAIVGTGFSSSDWEEEGERAFSVSAAIDYLLSRTDVNADSLYMAGLSLGGEVALMTAALDTRVSIAVAAGYAPDMYVMDAQGNHPCYCWDYADIHEYLDVSDYAALISPRALVVQTGRQDHVFSDLPTPWASAKQVTRRARAAYDEDQDRLLHYLHYDEHRFHVGDHNPTHPSRPRGITETLVVGPRHTYDVDWQTDDRTIVRPGRESLYAVIAAHLSSDPADCAVTLAPGVAVVTSTASNGTISVVVSASCGWSVAQPVPHWLHVSGAGSGSGTAHYTVDANPGREDRTGTVVIGNAVFFLLQEGNRLPPRGAVMDFCDARVMDLAVWRPLDGMWHSRASCDIPGRVRAYQWGIGTLHDRPVPGDYDGDGITDPAVWRPSTGTWHVRTSSSNFQSSFSVQWGAGVLNDVPVPADFDGDGRTDIAVWRPSNGTWYVRTSSSGYQSSFSVQWGAGVLNDVPVPGDYDGDGRADLAVWRPGDGIWHIRTSTSGYQQAFRVPWGAGVLEDIPVPADYDGDGRTDIAVWRPADGIWYIRTSRSGYQSFFSVQWGTATLGDVPVPADYDGDGRADVAVWRRSTGTWHIRRSATAYTTAYAVEWGAAVWGDVPMTSGFSQLPK